MFIVKAVSWDSSYRLFQCERVRVENWRHPSVPSASTDPQKVVRMYDNSDAEFVTAIYVGISEGAGTEPGSCQVDRVYVMTEDGKTVDSVLARRPPVPMAPEDHGSGNFHDLRRQARRR